MSANDLKSREDQLTSVPFKISEANLSIEDRINNNDGIIFENDEIYEEFKEDFIIEEEEFQDMFEMKKEKEEEN